MLTENKFKRAEVSLSKFQDGFAIRGGTWFALICSTTVCICFYFLIEQLSAASNPPVYLVVFCWVMLIWHAIKAIAAQSLIVINLIGQYFVHSTKKNLESIRDALRNETGRDSS